MPDRKIDRLTLYGEHLSGNCMKTKWVATHLGLDFEWVEMDLRAGDARTDAFRSVNPFCKVPMARWPDGRVLTESNAIILHFAETNPGGDKLLPQDPFHRAEMMAWLFWEQYSHEPYIAVRRFQKFYMSVPDTDIPPHLLERGNAALARMEDHLKDQDFFVDGNVSLADVSLVAYTRLAHEGGFDLNQFPSVQAWVTRTEDAIGIE